jgi:hypothetical protein
MFFEFVFHIYLPFEYRAGLLPRLPGFVLCFLYSPRSPFFLQPKGRKTLPRTVPPTFQLTFQRLKRPSHAVSMSEISPRRIVPAGPS